MLQLNLSHAKHERQGFTIVELLIVIVVIGILAAIIIVAFNGVRQRATVATIDSDLNSSAQQLGMDLANTGTYPATTALANGGAGLRASAGTTYQYTVDNTASPPTFCITATNGSTSYFASSTNNTPTAGSCPGQGANGVAPITNLATNPSLELNTTNWASQWYGSNGGGGTFNTLGAAAYAGSTGYRKTWTAAGGGQDIGVSYAASSLIAGKTYTFSAYLRASVATNNTMFVSWRDSSNNAIGSSTGTGQLPDTPNVWLRLSFTATAPAGATGATLVWGPYPSSGSPTAVVGQTIDFDAVMITEGSTLYNYADGASTNWVWNGTPNASTSTGSPL